MMLQPYLQALYKPYLKYDFGIFSYLFKPWVGTETRKEIWPIFNPGQITEILNRFFPELRPNFDLR